MSLVLPTDLVADVLKAAEPRREMQARSRLEATAGTAFASQSDALTGAASTPGDSAGTAETATDGAAATLAYAPRETMAVFQGRLGGLPASAAPQTSLNGQLEAFFLSRAVESMMPADQKAFFGEGPGADTWRSMLADQFGSALQSGGSLGILPPAADTAKTADKGENPNDKQRPV